MSRKPYTDRAVERYLDKRAGPPLIADKPLQNLTLSIAIPAYHEPDIIGVLENLYRCTPPGCGVEVLVGINQPETAPAQLIAAHKAQTDTVNTWAGAHRRAAWRAHAVHLPPLPAEHAGVGLARRLIMDEALRRLHQAENTRGVIVCLDADCRVDGNYLEALFDLFGKHPDTGACTIYFEHPLDRGTDSDERIARYEAFLRYYRLGLHYAGSAHAYHSVGSCLAVRAAAYARQGGMSRRQAGEDFYFIQKLIDGEQVATLNTTRVIPSARESDRVPFGTGRAMHKSRADEDATPFYAPQVFDDLKAFFTALPALYTALNALEERPLSAPMHTFLGARQADTRLLEIKRNAASADTFVRRAKRWFNGFLCMKYARFACPAYYPHPAPEQAVAKLLRTAALANTGPSASYIDMVRLLRTIDRKH
ncbi:MAG: glycosyltransferase family 2 protein [Gammaproteobacteria bacterium]|nr:glycosyltransferase family 2 protein [Gammaproteobacteria bacterium]